MMLNNHGLDDVLGDGSKDSTSLQSVSYVLCTNTYFASTIFSFGSDSRYPDPALYTAPTLSA